MLTDKAYNDFAEALGEDNVSTEPVVLEGYTWQPTFNSGPDMWAKRPVAVVLPSSTEEVQAIMRLCNKHKLKFKAFSTGWGIWSGATIDDVVIIDLRRMNRILEIDEKNMYIVVEPYVNGAQIQAEAMKLGLNTHIIGAGPNCSPLASATSAWGVGHDSIYMSYSARNVMGVEWVLPTGEILRLGTPGMSDEWFCGDGPGPSLRGMMRGSCGALGGNGVFTKCAIKLFNWPGPSQPEVEGIMLDGRTEIPDNVKFYLCFFKNKELFSDALYKFGESEIGYNALRTSFGAYIDLLAPRLFHKLTETSAIRSVLADSFRYSFALMLAANSDRELEYQDMVFKKIVSDHGGFALEGTKIKPFFEMLFMSFVRATIPALIFRMGGAFSTALDRNEALDSQTEWDDACTDIKLKWIAKGATLDDLGDNPYFVPYENNTWAHCEVVYQFDPRNEKHLNSLQPMFNEFTAAALELCMEPMFSSEPGVRKLISPIAGNFSHWQRKIWEAVDPHALTDSTNYIAEEDINFESMDSEVRKKIETLISERNWIEKEGLG